MKPFKPILLFFLLAIAHAAVVPAQQSSVKAAQEAFDSGTALRAQKDFAAALKAFSKALLLDPDFSEAWRQRGLTYRDLNQLKKALADVDRAILTDPNNAKAFNARSLIKYAQKDWAGSLSDCDRALELDPHYSSAYMNRGHSKYQMGDKKGAITDYDKAVAADPKNASAIYSRGVVRVDLKQDNLARADFQTMLEMDPDHPNAAQARAQLAKISGGGASDTLTRMAEAADAILNLPRTLSQAPSAPASSPPSPPPSPAAGEVPASRPSGGASPPEPEKAVTEAETVSRVFLPQDPLDRSAWPAGDVLWEAARTPSWPMNSPAQAIRIPAHLDFNHLSPAIYAAAVSTAKEAMRLLQGPLSAAEQKAFDAKWAPYFDYPSPEVIDYLNQLNPLLARFLAARAGFSAALQALHKALAAAAAAGLEADPQGVATAMTAARLHKTALDGYQKAMAEAEAAIAALGPMPNPYEVRARHAKAFADAVAANPPRPGKKEPAPSAAEYWVLAEMGAEEKRNASGDGYVYSFTHSEGFASGALDSAQTDQISKQVIRESLAGTATWTIPPRLIKEEGAVAAFDYALAAQCTEVKPASPASSLAAYPCASVQVKDSMTQMSDGVRASGTKPSDQHQGGMVFRGNTGPEFFLDITVGTAGGSAVYHYKYVLQRLSAAQAAEIQAKADDSIAKARGQAARTASDDQAAAAARKAKAEALAFQKEMSLYFAQQGQRAAEELAQATDPRLRQELAVQVMAYDADRAAAEDNAVYLETGQWQRTRTTYDDYNFAVMDKNAREEAARIREPENIANAALHQINLMPPELRDAVRATWESQVNGSVILNRDTATMKKAAAAVAAQVRGYWDGVAGRENDKAFVMDGLTKAAQATEIGAGVALVGVAGAAAAGAGLAGTTLWAAETLAGAAYGGATGYVAGGPDEAARRSLQWAGTLGFAASEALDGYEKSGDAATAIKQGVTALVLAKTMEIGLKWGAGKLSPTGPTGQEAAEVARFERGMAAGKQAIKRAEKAELALSQALSKGAPAAEINRLSLEAERHAATLNADWYAKFQLKLQGPSVAGQAFDKRISAVYEKTMPDFTRELEKLGYDVSRMQFRPLRNPSSAGTVSMDLDLALVETPGLLITKSGVPVSRGRFLQEAQAAWNKVYMARTGQDAKRSLLNITNSMHQEAFSMKLLEKRIPLDTLTPAEVTQAADVLRVKVSDIPLPAMAKFVENARGLEKEMRTKVLPYFTDQAARAAGRGDTAKAQAMREAQKHWQAVYNQLAEIGKHEHSPVELWRLQQQLKDRTGGKNLWDIADSLGVAWEAAAKVK